MLKLKSKKYIPYSGKVYDLEVANSHSYNIEGISVHNSAAGCLLSWCLEIVEIDPIRFHLYFERFLNPTRKGYPDIDLDTESGSEECVQNFLINKYGKESVINVATFITFNEKGCLKDVVRAHRGEEFTGFDSDVFQVTREMPNFTKVEYSLKDWFKMWPTKPDCSPRVKNWLLDPENKIILQQTIDLQGKIKNVSQHAAGITIFSKPVWEYIPVNVLPKDHKLVTAFQEADKSSKDLSDLKILKLDILKLETLNVIKEAIQIIKKQYRVDVSYKVKNVDLNDKNLYYEILLGNNHGIFQFESHGMNNLLKGVHADRFDDIVACNALYRPGAMGVGSHVDYARNKFNPSQTKYVHPALESVLKDTHGVLVYQEQVMFIANKIAGLSLGDGDNIRRYLDKASQAITKKMNNQELSTKEKENYEEFEKYWNKFIDGAKKNGFKEKEVEDIKNWLIKYLGYSFNKSHALSYSYLAMQTLYLKHYYPGAFYTALLNHPKSGEKEEQIAWMSSSISAAISKGIKILPPSKKSLLGWNLTGDNEITMGFRGINGMGEIAYEELVMLLSEKGKNLDKISPVEFFGLPFSKFNKKNFEVCVKSGMFDGWSTSREQLYDLKDKKRKKQPANQMALFDMNDENFNDIKIDEAKYPPTLKSQKSKEFLEVCNFDLQKIEKMVEIKNEINKRSKFPIENIMKFEDEGWYWFVIEDFKKAISKNGNEYVEMKIGDGITKMSMRAFGSLVKKMFDILERDSIYISKFERNKVGFLNFKKNTPIKKINFD